MLRHGFEAMFELVLFGDSDEFIDGFDHVYGNTYSSRLVSDGSCDGLSYPPSGVGREFVSASVFEFVDGFHESDISLLYEVEELESSICIFFCDGDDESEVGFDHFFFSGGGGPFAFLELDGGIMEFFVRESAYFDGIDDGFVTFHEASSSFEDSFFPRVVVLGHIFEEEGVDFGFFE